MEQDDEKKRVHGIVDTFSKGVIYQMGSFGLSKMLGVAFTIIVLNYFATQESDLLFTANAFVNTISTLASLGLGLAAVKFFPGMIMRKEGGRIRTEILSAIVLMAIIMAALFGAAYVLPKVFPGLEFVDWSTLGGLVAVIFALSLLVLETAYITSVLNAFKQFFATSLVTAIIQVLRLLIVLALIYFGLGKAFEMLSGYALTYTIVGVYLAWVAWGKIKEIGGTAKLDFWSLKRNIAFGLPIYLSSIIDSFLTQMDIILIAFFLGGNPGIVSGYTAVILIVRNIAPVIVSPLVNVQQPILAEEHDRGSPVFLKITREVSRWAFYLGLPTLLVFLAFDFAFMHLIAPAYAQNAYIMWLFAPFVIASLLSISFRNALMARGHVKTLLGISVMAVAINLALDWWLIPTAGIAGAAIGSSIAIVCAESTAIFMAGRKFGGQIHPDVLKAFGAFLAALGLAFVNLPYFGQLAVFSRGGILALVLSMTVVCTAYLAVLFALRGFKSRDFETGLGFLENNGLAWVSGLLKPACDAAVKYTG
ncbi:MAG: polysaccharide biosynthesis C-terminal domain-containing protein [Candidatus Micrarchaeota archaeon]